MPFNLGPSSNMNMPMPQQGMNTGPSNIDALLQMIMNSPMQQQRRVTSTGQQVMDPNVPAPRPAIFDQRSQPSLGSISPRNNMAPQGPLSSSPLTNLYRNPMMLNQGPYPGQM